MTPTPMVCLNLYTAYAFRIGDMEKEQDFSVCVCVCFAAQVIHTLSIMCVFSLYGISIWPYMIMYRGLMRLILAL